ncbi:MAG: tyrosine-type recombinase/integrase [Bacteroidia bacterium]
MRKKQVATSGVDWNVMLGLTQRLKQDEMYRDYLLITVGCYFGLRIGDLLKLRWCDVADKDELLLKEEKTGKLRKITINAKVSEAVNLVVNEQRLKDSFNENEYMFANQWGGSVTVSYVNKRLKFLFDKYHVSVKNPSSHTLRKTFGKRVYESDNKSERALIYLSEIFSHSSITITRKYIGITQEQIADVYMSI